MTENNGTNTQQGFKESKVDEDTRQESLDHVGFLFAYIADKDIFHKYYSKLLSKRIIQLTSVSDEAEERMLKNMRKVRGGREGGWGGELTCTCMIPHEGEERTLENIENMGEGGRSAYLRV